MTHFQNLHLLSNSPVNASATPAESLSSDVIGTTDEHIPSRE